MDKLLKEFENHVFPSKKAGLAFMNDYLKKVCSNDYLRCCTILSFINRLQLRENPTRVHTP